ncbi:unnamed protein product [Camellia sinensis]
MASSISDEVTHDFSIIGLRVYKDSRVDRFKGTDAVPPSNPTSNMVVYIASTGGERESSNEEQMVPLSTNSNIFQDRQIRVVQFGDQIRIIMGCGHQRTIIVTLPRQNQIS